MEDLNALVKKWRSAYFPKKDDRVWKQWSDFELRDIYALVELLSADVRDSLKRRAIFLLIVPSSELNPIYWKGDIGDFYYPPNWLDNLTPELLEYTMELVVEFVKKLQPLHYPNPRDYAQADSEHTVFEPKLGKYNGALCFYNYCIQYLLERATDEQAEKVLEKVFPFFSLNDPSVFSGPHGDSSGYSPFKELLLSRKIPNKWKIKADGRMREIIANELSGKTKPRVEWEDAFSCYSEIILSGVADLPYPVELFFDQLQFIMDHPRGEKCIDGYLYLIARYVVLEKEDNNYRFLAKETAKLLLEKFGERDEELASQIQSLLSVDEKETIVARDKEKEKEEAEILAAMK